MRAVFVHDDAKLAVCKNILTGLTAEQHFHVLTKDERPYRLYDIATKIKEYVKPERSIIFIDLYLACSDPDFCLAEDNAGIALIKFLRMLEVKDHITLIGPFATEKFNFIKNEPGNLIISSGGISLEKYLYDFRFKSVEELALLAGDVADQRLNLAPYILTEFRLPEDERHNWANWWGIVQLTDVHRSMFPDELSFPGDDKYPARIDIRLKSLRSVQALHLFGHTLNFGSALDQLELEKLAKPKRRLTHEINILKQQIGGAEKPAKNKPEYWFDYINARRAEMADYLRKGEAFTKEWFEREIEKSLQEIEKGKVLLTAKELELGSIDDAIRDLNGRKISSTDSFKERIKGYRCKSVKPRIIHIDDNAKKGWSEIFQLMIYGQVQPKENFVAFHDTDKDIDELYDDIRTGILELDPNLIMLDLRLKNESGAFTDTTELSGAIILKKIRNDFPGLPVIMTTASNKTWSYQALLNLGADAYWIKEGIDLSIGVFDQQRAEFSLENYRELLRNIFALCGEDYQFLNRYGNKLKQMQQEKYQKKWWWKTYKSNAPDPNRDAEVYFAEPNNFNGIFDMLTDGIHIYRRLLQQFLISEHDHFSFEHERNIYRAQVINRLAGIIEAIHFGDEGYFSGGLVGRQNYADVNSPGRRDYFGWYLLQFRNNASHYSAMLDCENRFVRSFIGGLLSWLDRDTLGIIQENKLIGIYTYQDVKNKKWWYKDGGKDIVDYFEEAMVGSVYEQSYQAILNPITV